MARKKAEPVYGCFWTIEEDDEIYAMIYTESTKALKTKVEPFATYMQQFSFKPIAYQYKLNINDERYEKLMKELGLTEKDKVLTDDIKTAKKRTRRTQVF